MKYIYRIKITCFNFLIIKTEEKKRVTFTIEQKKNFERKEQGAPKRKILPECSQKQQEKNATGNY